jgi:hypothetical protein
VPATVTPPISTSPQGNIRRSRTPLLLVVAATAFNLVELRAERNFTPMLNDGSVHAQMVRAATAALRRGQLPLTTWYPNLGLGSPQFLHYQSLGATVTGAAGLVVGPNRAFAWSLYLLVALWPISVYGAGRLFGCSRQQAAVAAACAPFVMSNPSVLSIGYEPGAYLWIGYGLWSQLFGMWTLPIAWGASWRYVATGRFRLVAVLAATATIGAHFMTGYLALLAVIPWVAVAPGALATRLRRGAIYLVATGLCSAWVIYPVIHSGNWASVNEFLQHTVDADSYGARQAIEWLVTGDLLDAGRFPIITMLFAAGLVACVANAKRLAHQRALLGAFVLSLLLFFGRPTLGPLIDLLPGSHDLFLRRFLMGVQLSALLIAGIGAVALKDAMVRFARAHRALWADRVPRRAGAAVALAACIGVLAPAWSQIASYDSADASDITIQHRSLSADYEMGVITSAIAALPPGRVYAGLPAPSWGGSFTVGEVPVFKYLSNLDFDMVGFTLRTASLMTDPEAYFDENNAGDYAVFGIRYLVLPVGRRPVPRATLVVTSGRYRLWEITGPNNDYVQVASTEGSLSANRENIGEQTEGFLHSGLPGAGIYETVAYGGVPAAADTVGPNAVRPTSVGRVGSERVHLDLGVVTSAVTATARAAVILKASYDPGWRATVDGRPATTYMVSPALVAVTVGPGRHTVTFEYHGYGYYPELFALAGITIVVLLWGTRRRRR